MQTIIMALGKKFTLHDYDVINASECVYSPESKGMRLWVLLRDDEVLCAAFAEKFLDALDIAAEHGWLEHFELYPEDVEIFDASPNLLYVLLGPGLKPYDISKIGYIEMVPPVQSVCAQYGSHTWALSSSHARQSAPHAKQSAPKRKGK